MLAIGFEASISLGAALVAFVLAVGTIAAILGGGRRWRENYDAENAAHKHTAELLSARDATLLEKDKAHEAALEERDSVIQGMQGRLKRLDETLQEMGGKRVVDQLLQMQKEGLERYGAGMQELAALFGRVAEKIDAAEHRNIAALDAHEERAAERAERFEDRMAEREGKMLALLGALTAKVEGR